MPIAHQTVFARRCQGQPPRERQILQQLAFLHGLCETEELHILAAGCVLGFDYVDS